MEKLRKIQAELKVEKKRHNPFGDFYYYNNSDILDAVKPLLKAEECTLILTDEIKEISKYIYIEASAKFSDGTNEVTVTSYAGIDPNKGKMDLSQCFGSASTYARKYALNGLFLIDDGIDPDGQDNTEEGTSKPEKKYEDDDRPWLSEDEFNQAKDRVPKEAGLIDEIKKKYKMKKVYREELEKLSK